MRLIDANALISDLEHDVERDMALLDTLTLGRVSRESIQFDKDWKQNTIDLLMRAPTIEPEPNWIPFHKRPLTKEEQKEHKDWCWILNCELPDDNQEVLISSPYFGVYIDTFYNDGECSFDGGEEIKEGMAWMPLPEPYRGEGGEE